MKHQAALILLMTAIVAPQLGCSGMSSETKGSDGDPQKLRFFVTQFHRNLRWARYEQASQYIEKERREGFLGRYEELGEDFHIVELEVKSLDFKKGDKTAKVEVLQRWYREPNMTVRSERYVETWTPTMTGWSLTTREKKKELKRRKQKKGNAKPNGRQHHEQRPG